MNSFAERADFEDKLFEAELQPDTSFTDDPEDGSTEAERTEQNERQAADDFDATAAETRSDRTPVKLFTVAVKWACALRVTDKEWKGRTFESRVQTLFTIRGNRIVLLLAKDAQAMKEGAHHGMVCEIFGADFDEKTEWDAKNEKNVKTRIVKRAHIFIKRNPVPAVAKQEPQLSPTATERRRHHALSRLQARLHRLESELRMDDTREIELTRDIEDTIIKMRMLERGEWPKEFDPDNSAPTTGAEVSEGEKEIRALIRSQRADHSDAIGEEHDKDEADGEPNAEHDEDGAELERSTEPWADSSIPLGATVDPDCWDCPCRFGATCNSSTGCILN